MKNEARQNNLSNTEMVDVNSEINRVEMELESKTNNNSLIDGGVNDSLKPHLTKQLNEKRKIKKKSNLLKIDPKITKRIWKNMIWSYIAYEKRNFKKK